MPATATTSYAVNGMNQYTAIGAVTPTYDGRGNTTFDGTNHYTYDTENRLVSATVPGHTIAYSYDPEGRLGQETVDAGTPTSFYYDGLVPMSDYTFALFGPAGSKSTATCSPPAISRSPCWSPACAPTPTRTPSARS